MTRKLGWLLVVLTLSSSAIAAVNPGTISGFVRDVSGVPQMGAMVQVLASPTAVESTAYTDTRGFFSVRGLLPGSYTIKVSAPSFLPTVHERVGLQSGATLVVNVTLNTLFQAIQLIPKRSHGAQEDDEWRWTLRSMANRPILRVMEDGSVAVVQNRDATTKNTSAKLAFMAGSNGETFGGSDMSTAFSVVQSLPGSGRLGFSGDLGYGVGAPVGTVRASYSYDLPNGSHPQLTIMAKRFATPNMVAHGMSLQAATASMSDTSTIGNWLELNYGGELQLVELAGRTQAFRPFGSAALHFSKDTVVEYRLTTSSPNTFRSKAFDELTERAEDGPRVSLHHGSPQLERVRHQEISISHRIDSNKFQVALFSDQLHNAALTGMGSDIGFDANLVPDDFSGTFLYNSGSMHTSGVRAVYQRTISENLTGTIDYAYGGALISPNGLDVSKAASGLRTVRRHSATMKLTGTLPRCGTHVVASYEMMNGKALTPVDMFNTSAGQADPFFSVFVRQPIPAWRFIPGGVEVLVDIRNLLAEGYQPVLGPDGQTVYLVQTARSVRGGLSFTF